MCICICHFAWIQDRNSCLNSHKEKTWLQSKGRLTHLNTLTHTLTRRHTPAHICSSVSLLETVTCLAGSVTWADGTAQLGPPNLSINLLHAIWRACFSVSVEPMRLSTLYSSTLFANCFYSHILQINFVALLFLKRAFSPFAFAVNICCSPLFSASNCNWKQKELSILFLALSYLDLFHFAIHFLRPPPSFSPPFSAFSFGLFNHWPECKTIL